MWVAELSYCRLSIWLILQAAQYLIYLWQYPTLPFWASLTPSSVKLYSSWLSLAMAFLILLQGSSSSLNDDRLTSIVQVVWWNLGCVIHVPHWGNERNFFDPFKSSKMWSYFTLYIHILTLISFPNSLNDFVKITGIMLESFSWNNI